MRTRDRPGSRGGGGLLQVSGWVWLEGAWHLLGLGPRPSRGPLPACRSAPRLCCVQPAGPGPGGLGARGWGRREEAGRRRAARWCGGEAQAEGGGEGGPQACI
jgi:hypothetical protein